MRTSYKIIETEDELWELISYCKQTGYCSFDFETNTTKVHEHYFYPTILGISFQPGSGWIIPLGHKDSPFREYWQKVLRVFALEVIENPSIVKVAWNALFDGRIFRKYGYRIRGRYMDAMLAKYILNEERPSDLKSMVAMFLPDFSGYDLSGKPGQKASEEANRKYWSNVPLEELSKYCAGDCEFTLRIFLHLEQRLIESDLYYWLRNFYMPLVRQISDTILKGVHVDREYLVQIIGEYQEEIAQKQADLYNIPIIEEFQEIIIEDRLNAYLDELDDKIDYGGLSQRQIDNLEERMSLLEAGQWVTQKEAKLFEPLNFASPKQMIELFYTHEDGFEFPVLAKTKTKAPSTSEETLLKLQFEDESGFIKGLLELRALSKLYSTYVKNVYEDFLSEDDTIHPTYLLHGTVTGRLSSRQPNFQNIPRTTTSSKIKKMYIAPPGRYFLEVDLSQAELRTAAEASKDEAMIQIFKEGKNMHVATAAKMFDVDYDLINSARKDESHPQHIDMVKKHKSAKVLNFTIFYGAGPKKVMEFLIERTGDKYTVKDAAAFINRWFDAFPEAEKWIENTRKKAKKDGYVTSIFGRKRRLPILMDKANEKWEQGLWNEALRQSVNSLTQSMSSDITQWISIQVYIAILRGELPSYLRLVSTVHDSNEYYPKKEDLKLVTDKVLQISSDLPDIKKYLRGALFQVPMKASAEYGLSWGHMFPYNPREDKDYVTEYEILSQREKDTP